MFQECIKNKNTSDVNLDWSIWKNAINEAVLDVIGKLRKVNIFQRKRLNRLKIIHDKTRNYDCETGQCLSNVHKLRMLNWFSPGTSVSFTNKTYRHDITEILLKVALNTITITLTPS